MLLRFSKGLPRRSADQRIQPIRKPGKKDEEEATLKKIKCLSLLLALVLVLGMLPVGATAEGTAAPYTFNAEKSSYIPPANHSGIHIVDAWFDINATAEEDIKIDVGSALNQYLWGKTGYINPVHQFRITVHIQNHSPNAFKYQNNGMTLGTVKNDESTSVTNFTGYDGNKIPLNKIGGIAYGHPAIEELFGSDSPSLTTVLNMYDLLEKKGFTGSEALSDYFLAYYRQKYSKPELTWDGLLTTYRNQVISDCSKGNPGYFSGNSEVWTAINNSRLKDYAYNPAANYIQIKWPEEKLAAMSYNLFYQDLFSVVFGDVTVNQHEGKRVCGVGDYVDVTAEPYFSANKYLATICGTDGQLDKDEEGNFKMTATLEGRGAGNSYANYEFDALFNLTLQFIRATTSVSVEKKWEDEDNHDGIRPQSVSVQLYADGKPSGNPVQLNKENQWKHTFENLSKYADDKEVTYTVNEVEVPAEYTATVEGSAAQGFVITNSHELRPVETPTQPPVVTPTPAPATPTATPPQTGDNANVQLWFALACLSLAAMAVAFTKSRARRKG